MQKFISARLIENTPTSYIVDVTIETRKIFQKPAQVEVRYFKEKQNIIWRYLSTGRWEDDHISNSLNAFISTGKESIIF